MLRKKPNIIRLMIGNGINVFELEPRIMIMCVETEEYDLMSELIALKVPVHTQDFRCIYQLTEADKLDLLKNIINTYVFPDVTSIIGKICTIAVMNGHVNILEYFCPKEGFDGAPDIIYTYFINGIKYGGHLPVIKYFIENGICIAQENYQAVRIAVECQRGNIIKYFCEKDENVINILTSEEKEKFGLIKLPVENKYLGTNVNCNIYYNNINDSDKYYECEKNLHHYSENTWNQWIKNKTNWLCPHCFCQVKRIVYVNKL
jgi:hypothetical protein